MPFTFQHDGVLRDAYLPTPELWKTLPTGWWSPSAPMRPAPPHSMPVIVALHDEPYFNMRTGFYEVGHAQEMYFKSRLHLVPKLEPGNPALRYLVLYPQALGSRSTGVSADGTVYMGGYWNNGYYGREREAWVDDVGFIAELLMRVMQRFFELYEDFKVRVATQNRRSGLNVALHSPYALPVLDVERIYLVGLGSGGAMAYRLALELPARLSALYNSQHAALGMVQPKLAGIATVGASAGGWLTLKDYLLYSNTGRPLPHVDWTPSASTDLHVLAIQGMGDTYVIPGDPPPSHKGLLSTGRREELLAQHAPAENAPCHFSMWRTLEPWATGAGWSDPFVSDTAPLPPGGLLDRWRWSQGGQARSVVLGLRDPNLGRGWPGPLPITSSGPRTWSDDPVDAAHENAAADIVKFFNDPWSYV